MGKPKKFIVGGLLNVGAGLAGGAYSLIQERKARRELAQLDQAESGAILSEAARRRIARQESQAQFATDAAARSTAAALKAAQEAGGSRAVQAISPIAARTEAETSANLLQGIGETGARLSAQSDADTIMASRARTAPQRQNLMAAADAARQGALTSLGMLAGGLAEVAGGIATKGKGDTEVDTADTSGVRAGASASNKMGELAAGQMKSIRESIKPKPFEVPGVDVLSSWGVDVTRKRPQYEAGGKAMKTPGAFSHKANPIDVIKDGKKIAEMTGGEYIFNPKQSEKLKSLSAGGDSALHKFVRDLLSKRQFK